MITITERLIIGLLITIASIAAAFGISFLVDFLGGHSKQKKSVDPEKSLNNTEEGGINANRSD